MLHLHPWPVLFACALSLGLTPCATTVHGAAVADNGRATANPPLTQQQKIAHLLNRIGYGPRPGDIERVEKIGMDAYIQEQLHPERIDDSAADRALARFDTLRMSSSHLLDEFYGDLHRYIDQQKMYGNPAEMKMRLGIDLKKSQPPAGQTRPGTPSPRDLAQRDAFRCMSELQNAKLIRAAISRRQLYEVLVDFWENHFNVDMRKNTCRPLIIAYDRDAIRPHVLGKFRDLLGAVAHSPAMLAYLDNNENSVVRQRSALEKHVIELFISVKLGLDAKGTMSEKEGPNENYGREILELHTLGVDSGYTQKDVQEVARCFTGWTFNPFSGTFQFDPNRHDDGRVIVLGKAIPQGMGEKGGEMLLDILAREPSTAKFISRELCQRFVNDDPPAALVDRVANVFTQTDGDLRAVVQAIVTSPEFYAPAAYRAKIKSPFEYAVSAVRAADGAFVPPATPLMEKVAHVVEGAAELGDGSRKFSNARRKSLNWEVYDMGQPPFACAAPNGYSEVSRKWVSSGALIDRLNFAMALSRQDVTDVRIAPEALVKGADADQPEQVLDKLSNALLHSDISPRNRQVILKNALSTGGASHTINIQKLTALLLGSPEFQRR